MNPKHMLWINYKVVIVNINWKLLISLGGIWNGDVMTADLIQCKPLKSFNIESFTTFLSSCMYVNICQKSEKHTIIEMLTCPELCNIFQDHCLPILLSGEEVKLKIEYYYKKILLFVEKSESFNCACPAVLTMFIWTWYS